MEPTIMQFAREAYARYTATTGNKNYQGFLAIRSKYRKVGVKCR